MLYQQHAVLYIAKTAYIFNPEDMCFIHFSWRKQDAIYWYHCFFCSRELVLAYIEIEEN